MYYRYEDNEYIKDFLIERKMEIGGSIHVQLYHLPTQDFPALIYRYSVTGTACALE